MFKEGDIVEIIGGGWEEYFKSKGIEPINNKYLGEIKYLMLKDKYLVFINGKNMVINSKHLSIESKKISHYRTKIFK